MSDLLLKVVGIILVALPIVAFLVWAYKELGLSYFLAMLKGIAMGLLCFLSLYAGLGLLGLVK